MIDYADNDAAQQMQQSDHFAMLPAEPEFYEPGEPRKKPKQVILVRSELKMKPGKIASQVAHASMKVFFDRAKSIKGNLSSFGIPPYGKDLTIEMTNDMWDWKEGEFTKIVLQIQSEDEMLVLFAKAHAAGLPCALIQDNGHTVFHGKKTFTTCAIGPGNPDEINELTGHLKLMN
jgi:PTH2 family peptidyl-tRNA hydrolase